MILAIDAVGAKHSGAATVLQAIVSAALCDPRIARVVVFCSPRRFRQFQLPQAPHLIEQEAASGESGPMSRVWWQLRRLPAEAAACGADVLLCLSGGGIPPQGMPSVAFVQQSLPFSPEAMAVLSWRERARMVGVRWSIRVSCDHAALLIVQTPTMRMWVATAFGTPEGRIAVVEPHASLPAAAPEPVPELAAMRAAPLGRRLLYVGNTSAYKNLRVLPAAMARLRGSFPEATLFATVPKDHSIAQAGGISALPYLPPPALRQAYRLATAVVVPSLVETVGLPMLEAASLGVPVIAADRPYARDVCEDAAVFFDPHDPRDLASKVAGLLGDPARMRALSSRGEALARRREAAQPYRQIVDALIEAAARGAQSSSEGGSPKRFNRL